MPSSSERCIGAIEQAFLDTERLMGLKKPIPRSALSRRIAQVTGLVDGRIPGEMGLVGDQRHIVEEAVRNVSADDVSRIGRSLDDLFKTDGAAIQHTGALPEGISDDTMQRALATNKEKIVVQHPELFTGISPALRQVLDEAQSFQRRKLAIAQALGYPIEAIDGPYLRQLWDLPEAQLVGSVAQTRGRVSIAKDRVFGDILEGMEQGLTPTPHTVGELLEGASGLMDEAIADAFERQVVLRNWGTKGKVPAKGGATEFNHPLYRGWSGPQDIVNAIDQMHAPVGQGTRRAQNIAGALKNTVFGIADIGVFGVQVLRAIGFGGVSILAGTINRGLALRGLPHMYLADNLAHALAANVRGGVHIGIGPSTITLKGGTILKYIPFVGKALDAPITRVIDELTRIQFGQILTSIRLMGYEGDLMMLHLLGKNIDDTAVLRTAGDWRNAATGASRGAQRPGRRAAESVSLTSFQMTRSEMASWTQLANAAFNPKATSTERLLGMMTLANLGAVTYGLGSAVNMAFGNGPIPWNPQDSKWATIKVGGNSIPIIPQRGLIRAIAKSITALEKEDPEKLVQVWTQFTLSKASPAAGIATAAAGFGFEVGEGFKTGTLSAKGRLLNMLPLPPIAEQAITEPSQRGIDSMTESFFGLNPFPESEFDRLKTARQQVMDDRGISGSFEDLQRNSPEIALEIEADPRVAEAQAGLDEQDPRTRAGEGFQALRERGEEFRTRQQEDDTNLSEFFTSGGETEFTPKIWSDNARERSKELANRRDEIRRNFELEFADHIPDPGTVGAAIEAYFAVDIDNFSDSLTGEVDWGPFNDAQDRALSGLSTEQREGAMNVIRQNQTDIQRTFRELRDEEGLETYWDIPSDDQTKRTDFRRRNPRVDAILFITGSVGTLRSGPAVSEANALVRRIFGNQASVPNDALRSGAALPGPRTRTTGSSALPRPLTR